MTIPTDYPDWIGTAVSVAQSLVLAEAGNITINTFYELPIVNTEKYNSIELFAQCKSPSVANLLAVQATWYDGDIITWIDNFVIGGQSQQLGQRGIVSVAVLPARGGQVELSFTSDSDGVLTDLILTGSSRDVDKPQYFTTQRTSEQVPVVLETISLAAGASEHYYCGPFTNGMRVYLFAPNTSVQVAVWLQYLDTTWVLQRCAGFPGTAAGDTSLDIPIAGQSFELRVQNGASSAVTVDFTVTELPS